MLEEAGVVAVHLHVHPEIVCAVQGMSGSFASDDHKKKETLQNTQRTWCFHKKKGFSCSEDWNLGCLAELTSSCSHNCSCILRRLVVTDKLSMHFFHAFRATTRLVLAGYLRVQRTLSLAGPSLFFLKMCVLRF